MTLACNNVVVKDSDGNIIGKLIDYPQPSVEVIIEKVLDDYPLIYFDRGWVSMETAIHTIKDKDYDLGI